MKSIIVDCYGKRWVNGKLWMPTRSRVSYEVVKRQLVGLVGAVVDTAQAAWYWIVSWCLSATVRYSVVTSAIWERGDGLLVSQLLLL